MRPIETLGRALGGLLAPAASEGSLIRRARLFHPDGVLYRAEARALPAVAGGLGEHAPRLAGNALVRLSGAWWRWHGGAELPDALGVAIRFRDSAAPSPAAEPGDQDLLFATIRHVWSLPFSPLTTNVHDFLDNDYYAILPFEIRGVGRVKLRLVPDRVVTTGDDRQKKLAQAVALEQAVLRLEVRALRIGAPWVPVAALELRERVLLDQEALRFDPFRSGRGIVPSGFLQALRVAVYPASQVGRDVGGGPDDRH